MILKLIGDVSGCRVLDIGYGDGEFALELTKRGALVTGIDSSPAMIDAARKLATQHNAGQVLAEKMIAAVRRTAELG